MRIAIWIVALAALLEAVFVVRYVVRAEQCAQVGSLQGELWND